MKKILFTSTISFLLLLSCNKKEETFYLKDTKKKETITKKIIENDDCVFVLNFLNSYQKNYDKIYEKDFINYEGNFSINFDNVDYFIKETQLNKFFTEKYIYNFKEKLLKINEKLKSNPQNDGIIEGLESDNFLLTQEIEDCLNQIMNKKVFCKQINKDDIEVNFNNNHILKFIVKGNKIDEIKLK